MMKTQVAVAKLSYHENWLPSNIDHWFQYETRTHVIHVFKGIITIPIDQLKLLEGQDIKLASQLEISSGKVWSDKLGEFRNTAPILNKLIAKTY